MNANNLMLTNRRANTSKLFGSLLLGLLAACAPKAYRLPELQQGAQLPSRQLTVLPNGVEVRNGGYGSGAVAHPTREGELYVLTDRGPNVDHLQGKKFPFADYSPQIGHFKLLPDGTLQQLSVIKLKDPQGRPITGIPNPEGMGTTGEVPYDAAGNVLPFDAYGLDPEGLVAMPDGSFWISDEYGPHLVHFSAQGVELERMSPVGVNTSGRKLPAVLARRRANRGMEGLTITPDGKTLVGMMQSSLANPVKKGSNMQMTRILTFELATGKTRQYLYRQEKDDNLNSEIVALSATEFLVAERDAAFFGNDPKAQKTLYRIDLSQATDVSGGFEAADGLLVDGRTLEQCSWEQLQAAGIRPVQKTLAVDLVARMGYPHDKLEGLWLIDARTIGVINDDDFSIEDDPDTGSFVPKTQPGGKLDQSTLYLIRL